MRMARHAAAVLFPASAEAPSPVWPPLARHSRVPRAPAYPCWLPSCCRWLRVPAQSPTQVLHLGQAPVLLANQAPQLRPLVGLRSAPTTPLHCLQTITKSTAVFNACAGLQLCRQPKPTAAPNWKGSSAVVQQRNHLHGLPAASAPTLPQTTLNALLDGVHPPSTAPAPEVPALTLTAAVGQLPVGWPDATPSGCADTYKAQHIRAVHFRAVLRGIPSFTQSSASISPRMRCWSAGGCSVLGSVCNAGLLIGPRHFGWGVTHRSAA